MINLAKERIDFHNRLTESLSKYTSEVPLYFKADSNIRLSYPCVIYDRVSSNVKYANNLRYFFGSEYQVMIIDTDPDSEIVDLILNDFQRSVKSNEYVSDGLYHYIITTNYGVI